LSDDDAVALCINILLTCEIAKAILANPVLPRAMNVAGATLYMAVHITVLAGMFAVPRSLVAQTMNRILSEKTEVERPAPHEGPEGPSQS
jgi:hypothetical protein